MPPRTWLLQREQGGSAATWRIHWEALSKQGGQVVPVPDDRRLGAAALDDRDVPSLDVVVNVLQLASRFAKREVMRGHRSPFSRFETP